MASGILRRLVELLSRRARCRVGFPAWQACETVALGQSKLSQNSSPFDSCAPQNLIRLFPRPPARRLPCLAAHAARASSPAQPPAQRPENEKRPRQDRPRLYNVWATRSGLSVNGISRRGGRRSETSAGPRNGGLVPADAPKYMHYTAVQHVYSMYTHATPDPTYRLERYMASWLALRPSGVQPQARPNPGCRT